MATAEGLAYNIEQKTFKSFVDDKNTTYEIEQ